MESGLCLHLCSSGKHIFVLCAHESPLHRPPLCLPARERRRRPHQRRLPRQHPPFLSNPQGRCRPPHPQASSPQQIPQPHRSSPCAPHRTLPAHLLSPALKRSCKMLSCIEKMESESDNQLWSVNTRFSHFSFNPSPVWFQHYRRDNFHDESLPPGKWSKRESKQNWVCLFSPMTTSLSDLHAASGPSQDTTGTFSSFHPLLTLLIRLQFRLSNTSRDERRTMASRGRDYFQTW